MKKQDPESSSANVAGNEVPPQKQSWERPEIKNLEISEHTRGGFNADTFEGASYHNS